MRFTAVDLPSGAVPVALAASGEELLVGVRRTGQPMVPGLLRRAPDGTFTEVPLAADTPYGMLATWQAIGSDGKQVLAIGGERGGAHGNVRWSVWTGTTAGLTEQRQGFSTFGGYGAGDLIGAVVTPAGGAVVGTWQSARSGFDVAVWTPDGPTWTRQSSAGTALENSTDSVVFPASAIASGEGILVTGSRLALDAGGRELPAVWRSSSGNTGWARAELPDAGNGGAGIAAACWSATGCGVAGRVDGKLAVWRLDGDTWARVPGTPPVAVGDRDRLPAPFELDGQLSQLVSEGGKVKIASATQGGSWAMHTIDGPTGMAATAVAVGDAVYLLAGADQDHLSLWRADLAALY